MTSKMKLHFYMPCVLQSAADRVFLHRIRGKDVETKQLPFLGRSVSATVDGRYIDILRDGVLYHIRDSAVWKMSLPEEVSRASACVIVAGECPRVWWCSYKSGGVCCFYPKQVPRGTLATTQQCNTVADSECVVEVKKELSSVCFEETPQLLVVHKRGYTRNGAEHLVILDGNQVQVVKDVVPKYIPPTPVPQWSKVVDKFDWPTNVQIMTPEKSIGQFTILGAGVFGARGQIGDKIAALEIHYVSYNSHLSTYILAVYDLSGTPRFATEVEGSVRQMFIEGDCVYVYAERQNDWRNVVHVFSAEEGYIHTVEFSPESCVDGCGYTLVKYPNLERASNMCLEVRQSGRIPITQLYPTTRTLAALLVSREAEKMIEYLSSAFPYRIRFHLTR